MRFPLLVSTALLMPVIAASASAVTMAWTSIGNPGNACDPQPDTGFGAGCFGAVTYAYSIGTYEVTNAQYAEFLNAKAKTDPLALYDAAMADAAFPNSGGIVRTGSSGSYSYSAIAGRENMPVNFVSFYDAARFANWMNNGQGNSDTETGAYTLLGGTSTPSNGAIVNRNAGAMIALTSENEWYKAAYYDAVSGTYFDYPAGSDARTICSTPNAAANQANCGGAVGDVTIRGSYPGSASPYGTFDQGGNVWEWNEVIIPDGGIANRGIRGGSLGDDGTLDASARGIADPSEFSSLIGFRLVVIPEPNTGLLVIAGLLGLVRRRRRLA
jgi:formylglycine-generating enzyme